MKLATVATVLAVVVRSFLMAVVLWSPVLIFFRPPVLMRIPLSRRRVVPAHCSE